MTGTDWRLLRALRPDERAAVLAATAHRRFDRRETLFTEGDVGDSLHLLATGRAAVRARHPGVDRMLVEILAVRVRRLSAHLVEALHVPVDRRVVRRLLALCRQYGDGLDATVSLPLTQTELAELAGATRPTVNKVLRALQDGGAIALARGRIEVLDREALRRAAR